MARFDHRPEAAATLKERFVWMVFMGGLFFLLYGTANQFAHLSGPHPSLFMAWERQIPFVDLFIIPYMSSDLLFCIAFFMPYSRFELRVLAARVLFIVTVSVAVFLLFPMQFGFEKPQPTAFTGLFSLLEADLPYNQAPSLHVAFAVVLWASMRKFLNHYALRIAVGLWFWLVVASTLLVYQHHVIDLPAGALMGLVALYAIPSRCPSYLTERFSTPRALKMGLYHMAASVACVVAAFWSDGSAIPLVWLALSLLAVSLVYGFGLNALLAGKSARAGFWQWLMFLPYFAGNYLSWHYYRRKLPLMARVEEGVYLGRHPTKSEYAFLEGEGVGHAINLATEQQFQKAALPQTRFAFLDQTIQSPEALQRVVECIDARKGEGVYVHCALGLSRSVLAVSAWMLHQGYGLDEVEGRMQSVRPGYVQSPYMRITLEMYREFLEEERKAGTR